MMERKMILKHFIEISLSIFILAAIFMIFSMDVRDYNDYYPLFVILWVLWLLTQIVLDRYLPDGKKYPKRAELMRKIFLVFMDGILIVLTIGWFCLYFMEDAKGYDDQVGNYIINGLMTIVWLIANTAKWTMVGWSGELVLLKREPEFVVSEIIEDDGPMNVLPRRI